MKNVKALLVAASLFLSALSLAEPALNNERNIIYTPNLAFKQEGIYQQSPRFLNKNIPDQYGYLKTTIDIKNKWIAGNSDSVIPTLEGFLVIRQKAVMGTGGRSDLTDTQSIKIGDAYLGEIRHNSSKPVPWVKEAWVKAFLNPILGLTSDDVHTIKVGSFGHSVGRGIALGSEYGMSKDFLAVYSSNNDFCAPGLLISGTIPSKNLSYNAYIGFLENKSSSIKETFNTLKTNQIGRELRPWSGTGNNNTMYALSFTMKPINTESMKLETTPYIVFNRALDQNVEVACDSESNLGSVGINVNYESDNFYGFDCEIAANFGSEKLYNIDRNTSKIVQSGEVTKNVYSHIEESVSGNWVAAKTYTELKTELQSNRHLKNSEAFTVSINGTPTNFRSKSNRIRPAYENKYRGFMGVFDSFYKLTAINGVLSFASGYLSGGANPHLSETDKKYAGFVAMHEYYTGKYVTSAFMFDTRSIKRPLRFEDSGAITEDSSLTDMIFGGCGFTWTPESMSRKKFVLNSNMLWFFKELASFKVVKIDENTYTPSTTEYARKFMGTEINSVLSFEPAKNMNVSLKGAVFFPGTYYQDIKGIALKDDIFSKLDASDTQNIDSTKYRLSTDTAFNAQMTVEYRF